MDQRRIIIHSLDHARAAIAAAASLGKPVTLISAPSIAGFMGPLWFKAVVESASADHPDLAVTAILDCNDEPGTVMAALRAGFENVRYSGPEETRERLAQMGAITGATIEGASPAIALDLVDRRDLLKLCRDFLAAD